MTTDFVASSKHTSYSMILIVSPLNCSVLSTYGTNTSSSCNATMNFLCSLMQIYISLNKLFSINILHSISVTCVHPSNLTWIISLQSLRIRLHDSARRNTIGRMFRWSSFLNHLENEVQDLGGSLSHQTFRCEMTHYNRGHTIPSPICY